MEDTLKPNDVVLLSKFEYGALFPKSICDIAWLNTLGCVFDKINIPKNFNLGVSKRMKGLSDIQRGDIVIIKVSEEESYIIKRIIGLPGEKIEIRNGIVFCNNNIIENSNGVKCLYRAWINNEDIFNNLIKNLDIKYNSINKNIDLYLNQSQYKCISNQNCIDSIKYLCLNRTDNSLFPRIKTHTWTLDNYGPILIPAKGTVIELSEANIQLYRRTLFIYENKDQYNKSIIILNDEHRKKSYSFCKDYYFVIGDNRNSSADSREYGFIPKDHIIGKVYILFSNRRSKKCDVNT